MSLILDALRKSDRQRTRNAAERLRDGPPLARAGHAHLASGMLVLGVAALAIAAVIVIAGLESRRSATGGGVEIMENVPAPARASVRALSAEVVREPVATAVAPAMKNEAAPLPPPPTPVETARSVTAEEVAAPPLAALPAELRARLPEMEVNVHAFAEDPADRFVLINLRRYREGDRLQEGPVLRHILRDGVVLEFEDTLFSLSRR